MVWGGKGLDKFRELMFNRTDIKEIHDFNDAKLLFPSVQLKGGVNYFHIEKGYKGPVHFYKYSILFKHDSHDKLKSLNTEINGIKENMFIRSRLARNIIDKIWKNYKNTISIESSISSRNPFGLPSNFEGNTTKNKYHNIEVISKLGNTTYTSKENKLLKNMDWLNKWKVAIPKAVGNALPNDPPIKVKIINPGQIVTETFLIRIFDTKEQAESFKSFIETNIFRFIFNHIRYSHNITKKEFKWFPELKWNKKYSDKLLLQIYKLSNDDYNNILQKIGEINE